MNEKVLVEVLVPAAGQKYDVFLPLGIRMQEAVQLVAAALSDLNEGSFQASKDTLLCSADTGTIYDINREVAELGIQNGSRLMLI